MGPKRRRGSDTGKSERQMLQDPLDAMHEGHDPTVRTPRGTYTLQRAGLSEFDASVRCDNDGRRPYLLRKPEDIGEFFPSAITRERKNNLLVNWDFIKLLPPDWYVIVFELTASPGRYAAIPDDRLLLDGYPQASRSPSDPVRQAGFDRVEYLRLVLFPNAIRFLVSRLYEPLREQGVWPTARQVLMHGYVLPASEEKEQLGDYIDGLARPTRPWHGAFSAELHLRYWGSTATPVPVAEPLTGPAEQPVAALSKMSHACAADAVASLLVRLPTDATLLDACCGPAWLDTIVLATRALVVRVWRDQIAPDVLGWSRGVIPEEWVHLLRYKREYSFEEGVQMNPLPQREWWAYDADSAVVLRTDDHENPVLGYRRIMQVVCTDVVAIAATDVPSQPFAWREQCLHCREYLLSADPARVLTPHIHRTWELSEPRSFAPPHGWNNGPPWEQSTSRIMPPDAPKAYRSTHGRGAVIAPLEPADFDMYGDTYDEVHALYELEEWKSTYPDGDRIELANDEHQVSGLAFGTGEVGPPRILTDEYSESARRRAESNLALRQAAFAMLERRAFEARARAVQPAEAAASGS